MLSGLAPGVARAAALPARRAEQAARCASSPPAPGSRSRRKAESQDLCFLAGEGKRSFLARHGGLGERAGRDRRPRRAPARRRHRGHHDFTVGQRRGLGGGATRAALRARHRRRDEHGRRRLARGARDPTGCAVREATLHRPGGRVDRVLPALPLAPARLHGRAGRRRRAHRSSSSSSPSPPTASPRARPPACSTATSSSAGRRSPERLSRGAYLDWLADDVGRDPRDLPVLLRGARAPARALGVAGPAARRHLDPAHRRGHAAVQAVLRGPRGAAGASRLRLRSAAFARPTSRRSATRGAT